MTVTARLAAAAALAWVAISVPVALTIGRLADNTRPCPCCSFDDGTGGAA